MNEIIPEWMLNNPKRKLEKLANMIAFGELQAKLSQCKRNSNGAVIFNADFSAVHAIGYNGPPKGNYATCTEEEGNCLCIHAETNALLKLKTSETGLVMYTTTSPCWYCAGAILNSGQIDLVLWDRAYRDARPGLNLLYHNKVDSCTTESLIYELHT